MANKENSKDPTAHAVVKLLKGVLYQDDPLWDVVQNYENNISAYVRRIGLELHVNVMDGFAYLAQKEYDEEEEGAKLPRLMRRIPLSFEVSLLCVILREELEAFDASLPQQQNLFLSQEDLRERIRIYFRERSDETRLFRELDRYIRSMEQLGFLRKIPARGQHDERELYEVKRIIKARVTLDFMENFKQKLEDYIGSL